MEKSTEQNKLGIAHAPPPKPQEAGSHHLFDHWEEVSGRLRAAKKVALFLDFDGTLVPLRMRKEAARLDPATHELLRRLASAPNVKVYVISGRTRDDLKKALGLPEVTCAGLHGWELNGHRVPVPGTQRLIDAAYDELEQRLKGLENILIREKGPCFEVHYRGASSANIRKAHALIHQVIEPLSPQLRVLHGHKIWEVLPKEIEGKGATVKALMSGSRSSELPIYIGDDVADESAFLALQNGITVRVGRGGETHARYELRNPEEVIRFLTRLEGEIT